MNMNMNMNMNMIMNIHIILHNTDTYKHKHKHKHTHTHTHKHTYTYECTGDLQAVHGLIWLWAREAQVHTYSWCEVTAHSFATFIKTTFHQHSV